MIDDQRTYLDYPFVGVGIVVWKEDRFLLIRRGKAPRKGEWSIPGGRQEIGETVRETAVREVKEETGLEVAVAGLIDVVDSIRRDADDRIEFHATLIDFAAHWLSGEVEAGSDAMAVGWFTLDDLSNLSLWSETERIIRESANFIDD